MSLFDYRQSQQISSRDYAFYSLIMAAMGQADDIDTEKLIAMWPDIWDELQARYYAPGGLIGDEVKQ